MLYVQFVEWVGYIASAVVVVSLVMTSIMKLRVINTIGCALFVLYGLIVKAYPVAIANITIMLINIYNIFKLSKQGNGIR